MSKLHEDFLSVFVKAGGYIGRPKSSTIFNEHSILKARHIGGTTQMSVTDQFDNKETWFLSGDAKIYLLANKKLDNYEFEKFACIEAATYYLFYPKVRALIPGQEIDHQSTMIKNHTKLTKELNSI